MKYIFYFFFFFAIGTHAQSFNKMDSDGKKQGVWKKTYENGNLRYEGYFQDDIAKGIFYYYYSTGELKFEKEFFHNGKAAATYIFYRNGNLKASGLYVNDL
jgi:antitoxin component YwqK of YwqJK toxin-antitoxin module